MSFSEENRGRDTNNDIVGISKGAVALISGVGAIVGALVGFFAAYASLLSEWTAWQEIKTEHLESATEKSPVKHYSHEDETEKILNAVEKKIEIAKAEVFDNTDDKMASLHLDINKEADERLALKKNEFLQIADEKIDTATRTIMGVIDKNVSEALVPLASKLEVPELIDLEPFVLRGDLPDFTQFVRRNQLPSPPDLSPYALKAEVISYGSQVKLVSIESGMSVWCGATNKPETSCLSRPLAAATPWRLDSPK